MMDLMKTLIIIPSFNPDEKLLQVVEALIQKGFKNILLIDDGSLPKNKEPFEIAKKKFNCKVIVHKQNRGKGRALKTAFAYALEQKNIDNVITVDGDNQHSAEDIFAIAQKQQEVKSLVLGVRNFDGENVPTRSRVGNKAISFLFFILFNLKISDTQTGLRGIPSEFLPLLLQEKGERFEYETNVLLSLKKNNIPFCQIPIKTVYIEENETSHFRPIVDSFKILKLMLKFLLSSILSCVVDIGCYYVLFKIFVGFALKRRVFYATLISRIISSLFNYFANSRAVFHTNKTFGKTILKYYCLAFMQFLCSLGGVYLLTYFFKNTVLMKILVDCVLFLLSFKIQQRFIF